jgi:hypothetical protein
MRVEGGSADATDPAGSGEMRTFTSAGRRRRPSGMICGRAWVGTLAWPFLRDGSANVWWNGTCLAPERTGFAALSSCGGREVRGGQPDLGSCARGSGAGRVVHLWLPRRAGRGGRRQPRRRCRRVPPIGSVFPVRAFRSADWRTASIPSSRETSSATLRSLVRRKLFPPALLARPRTRRSSPWDRTSW